MSQVVDGCRIEALNAAVPEYLHVVVPEGSTKELASWISDNRAFVEDALVKNAALLFRGFDVPGPEGFGRVAHSFSPKLEKYVYRSTPRTDLGDGIYTATEYSSTQHIPLHCENAYQRNWPLKLMFFAAIVATTGGETPIADMRKVTARIPREIREEFEKRGVMYVRNYGTGVDLPWETAFQTNDRAQVEAFCRAEQIELEWRPEGLRTKQVCQVVAPHPKTGETVWFNQAHLFHVSSLEESAREAMLAVFEPEELPRNAYFGDGTPLDEAMLDVIRECHKQEEVAFPWQFGDVLIIDNMLSAHARRPYTGARKTLVAMAGTYKDVTAA